MVKPLYDGSYFAVEDASSALFYERGTNRQYSYWYEGVRQPCGFDATLSLMLPGTSKTQVETRINIRTILKKPPEAAKMIIMITQARKVLESWYSTYMEVRRCIEESGTDHRWEFDRKRLFEQTNYMARVCGDLLEASKLAERVKLLRFRCTLLCHFTSRYYRLQYQ